MSIGWTVDGFPVAMNQDWQCSSLANGGYDRMSGSFRIRAFSSVDQGSEVTAYRTDGSVLWQGQVMSPPKVVAGVASIEANGYRFLLDRYSQSLLYQVHGSADWVTADSNPHGYAINAKMQLSQTQSGLRFVIPGSQVASAGDSYAVGQQAAFVLWTENCDQSRINFVWDNPINPMPSFDLNVDGTTGPSGAFSTNYHNVTMTAGKNPPVSVNSFLKGDNDQTRFQLICTTAITNSSHVKLTIDNIKVWGRLSADEVWASDVATDVAQEVGLDPSAVTQSGEQVLPLYWTQSDAGALMDYLAGLMDWRWLVLADRLLDFGPYGGNEWSGAFSRGVIDGGVLQTQIYNKVRVSFTSNSGETRQVTRSADPDPLADADYDSIYDISLADNQPDNSIAAAVAGRVVDRLSQPRLVGSVDVHEMSGATGGYYSGYHLLAGDTLNIADAIPLGIGPQRVTGVTYSADKVTAALGMDLDVSRILWRAARDAEHHKRHPRRRK